MFTNSDEEHSENETEESEEEEKEDVEMSLYKAKMLKMKKQLQKSQNSSFYQTNMPITSGSFSYDNGLSSFDGEEEEKIKEEEMVHTIDHIRNEEEKKKKELKKKENMNKEELEKQNEKALHEKMRRELLERGMSPQYEPIYKRPIPQKKNELDFSDILDFVSRPAPKHYGMVKCVIERKRKKFPGINKFWFSKYFLYHEKTETFLLSARRRKKVKTSSYIISSSENELRRETGSYFGKVRANWSGTEFIVFDKGVNPTNSNKEKGRETRNMLAAVIYQANILGSKGPRKMKVIIPRIEAETGKFLQLPETEKTNLVGMYKGNFWDDLIILQCSQPIWSEREKSFVLNFKGRVKTASTKNFQIVDPKRPNRILMQFGRLSKNKFIMDFRYPFSAFQAFGIVCSAFDWKLACE